MHYPDFWHLLDYCKNYGQANPTRLGEAKEILNASVSVHPMQLPRRIKMRRELGYMELAMALIGVFDTEAIARVAPRVNLAIFGESAVYGPRLVDDNDQLDNVIGELRANPQSRRAIISIMDRLDPVSYHPCISSLQFQVRRGYLHTTVNYRSCDLWFGFPHDLIVLSGLTQVVKACVSSSLGLGNMHINMANAHIYQHQLGDIQGPPVRWLFQIPELPSLEDFRTWAQVQLFQNQDWTKGTPPEILEDFPSVPTLQPLKA